MHVRRESGNPYRAMYCMHSGAYLALKTPDEPFKSIRSRQEGEVSLELKTMKLSWRCTAAGWKPVSVK